ncbi:MAG: hypothetical protein AAGI88_10470 [Pseudomonadota bacterium]
MSREHVYASLLLLAGFVLLSVTIIGDSCFGRQGTLRPRPNEHFSEEVATEVRSMDALLLFALDGLTIESFQVKSQEEQLMFRLYEATAKRFKHGAASHNLLTNWPLWVAGTFRPEPINIKAPEILVRNSTVGLCGQLSRLLAELAEQAGIQARVVQLEGHVVMEAHFDNSWHMYDVTNEVPTISLHDRTKTLPSVEALINDPERLSDVYGSKGDEVVNLYLSTGNNRYGDPDKDKIQRERASEALKYAIPFLLIVVSGVWWRRLVN